MDDETDPRGHPAWVATCQHVDRLQAQVIAGQLDEGQALAMAAADVLAAASTVDGPPAVSDLMADTARLLAVRRRELLLDRYDQDLDDMAALTVPEDLSGLDR